MKTKKRRVIVSNIYVILFVAAIIFLFKGMNYLKDANTSNAKEDNNDVKITLQIQGKGNATITHDDDVILSGEGSVLIASQGELSVQIQCKGNNLIKGFEVNGVEQEISVGQEVTKVLTNMNEDTTLVVTFIECNILTVERKNCEVDIPEALYRTKKSESETYSYYYTAKEITIQAKPNEYCYIQDLLVNGEPKLLKDMPNVTQKGEITAFHVDTTVHTLVVHTCKETIPVYLKYGKGSLIVNGKSIKDGQKIERCKKYEITYIIKEENYIVDDISVNSVNVELLPVTKWEEYSFIYEDQEDSLTVYVMEQQCNIVSSCKALFELSALKGEIYWPNQYNTIYIKRKSLNISCAPHKIERILKSNNVDIKPNSISISDQSKIIDITFLIDSSSLKTDAFKLPLSTSVMCKNLLFLYDPDAPVITDYTFDTSTASKDVTVTTKDVGVAGVDQILYGTYEKHKEWKQKAEDGTYESLHEKADVNATTTIKGQSLKADEHYYVWAIDCASNISEPVEIDRHGPVLSGTTTEDWYNHAITVKGTADEPVSNLYFSSSYKEYQEHTLEHNRKSKSTSGSKAWSFNIHAKENMSKDYFVWAYDAKGNKSEAPYRFKANIDTTSPTLTLSRSNPEGQWSKEAVTIIVEVGDTKGSIESGIDKTFYSTVEDGRDAVELTTVNEKGQYIVQSPKDANGQAAEMNQTFYFWTTDKAGNLSDKSSTVVQVDTRTPEITSLSITSQMDNAKIVNSKFGICSNQSMMITVQAKDEGCSSGLGHMTMYQNGVAYESKPGNQGSYEFELSKPFQGEISFSIEDGVGHKSTPKNISQIAKEYLSSTIYIEKEAPQIECTWPNANYTDGRGQKWYASNMTAKIDCEDTGSGIASVRAWINGSEITTDLKGRPIGVATFRTDKAIYEIGTAQVKANSDGSYHIKIETRDFCDNVSVQEDTVYIDRIKPVICQFTFSSRNAQTNQSKLSEDERYGYYFQEKTKVRIQGSDDTSSGIRAIAYYTVNYGKNPKGVTSEVHSQATDSQGGIELVLASGFKGQIYAKAIDQVGLTSTDYSKPYGIIIENVTSNSETADIDFSLPGTSYANSDGKPLFKQKVTMKFMVKDYFNGIKSVDWNVKSSKDGSKNQVGHIAIDEQGMATGDADGMREIQQDRNLVTSFCRNISIEQNGEVEVTVIITDRSGHTCTKRMEFGIDQTKPEVNLQAPDGVKKGEILYYRTSPAITISVKESNFSPECVSYTLTNGGKDVVQKLEWENNNNSAKESIYTARMPRLGDGSYHLQLEVKDLAGNHAKSQTMDFVVDTTVPEARVTLSGTSISSGDHVYYKEGQTVTIVLSEVNFDPSQTIITCKRYDSIYQPTALSGPKTSGWSSNGVEHTTSLLCTEDGWYTIDVTCADLAGNAMQQSIRKEFCIDSTKPEIKIMGVRQQAAYNKEAQPVITVTDTNYDGRLAKISLVGSNGGEYHFDLQGDSVQTKSVPVQGEQSLPTDPIHMEPINSSGNSKDFKGYKLYLDCFPMEQQVDDIYTLTIEQRDIAGNVNSQSVEFSVNRFGSVYTLGSELQKLSGNYVQQTGEVSFMETNVSALLQGHTQIKLSHNGVMKNLTADKDYDVQLVSSKQEWCRYRYVMHDNLFTQEGRYTLTVLSIDESGNVNDSSLGTQIVFGVDKTKPIIAATNLVAHETYGEASKLARVSVSDNIGIENLQIVVNGQPVTCTATDEWYEFRLPSSDRKQDITIQAIDAAGNKTIKEIAGVYVTTSLWVRFFNHPLLLALVSLGCVSMMVIILIFVKRRKIKKNREIT